MRPAAIIEGLPVMIRGKDPFNDELGKPWTHGRGPFVVARVYRSSGYLRPWIRLAPYTGPGKGSELPGSFRSHELRPLTQQECRDHYADRPLFRR